MSANVNSTSVWSRSSSRHPPLAMSASSAVSALLEVMKNPSLVLSISGAFSTVNKCTGCWMEISMDPSSSNP